MKNPKRKMDEGYEQKFNKRKQHVEKLITIFKCRIYSIWTCTNICGRKSLEFTVNILQ